MSWACQDLNLGPRIACGCVTSARRRPQVGQHSSASGSVLLGLDGFEVLAAQVVGGEWQLEVQTTATMVGCVGCGIRAELHGRRTVRVRDLPIGGRPVVLCWRKRIWRCREPACGVRTWTEEPAGTPWLLGWQVWWRSDAGVRIGLAVPGRPIGPWSRRTGAPEASATGRDRSDA